MPRERARGLEVDWVRRIKAFPVVSGRCVATSQGQGKTRKMTKAQAEFETRAFDAAAKGRVQWFPRDKDDL